MSKPKPVFPAKRNPWDGTTILLTKNCEDCPYNRVLQKTRICGWGVSWKILTKPRKKLRKCEKLKDPEDNDQRSVHYLDGDGAVKFQPALIEAEVVAS